jgi:peptidoglycan/LPS O-acetylase OafA/YrhL
LECSDSDAILGFAEHVERRIATGSEPTIHPGIREFTSVRADGGSGSNHDAHRAVTTAGGTRSLPAQLESGLRESQLAGLDGIRAIAAFMVVFYHFGIPFVSGSAGVLMFFVLSGFLITWLLLRENDEQGTVSLRKFYARRSLRIFPAFYCYAAVAFAVVIIRHHARIVWPQALAALFYVSNYYQALNGDPNTGFSHTWSLAIEEQFYVLWPLTFLLLRGNYRRMSQCLAGAIVVIWIYRKALVFVFHVHEGYIYEAFDTRADHLLIGCLLAVVLRARMFPRLWSWISIRSWLAAVTAALLVISSVADWVYGPVYRDSISFVVSPLLIAVWITQLIALRGAMLWRWTSWGWVRYLGRISYSVYLYQQLLVDVPKKVLPHLPIAAQLSVTIAVIVLIASASFFFVERPFLRLKARFKQTVAGAAS